jgi:endonuclease/exonuclease/phosphatase family metal-dependent hydrolase
MSEERIDDMSHAEYPSVRSQRQTLALMTILLLFFFQLLTDFVEAVYIFGLLGSSIPPEIVMVLLFLSPLLLFAFGRRMSPKWVQGVAVIVILARAVEIYLSTRGRMIVGGIGVAVFLMYIPILLAQPRNPEAQRRFAHEAGLGLSLAVFTSILFRALLSGSDISSNETFRTLTLGLAVIALYLLFRGKPADTAVQTQDKPASTSMGRVHAYTLGLASVVTMLFFAFTAPNVIARWAGVSKLSVFGTLLLAWIVVGWWRLKQKSVSSKLILGWGLAFAAAMLFTILPHQVAFPPAQDIGYPLQEPQITVWQYIPLYLMLLLSPVLLLAFVSHLDNLLAEEPRLGQLAGAFGLAGFYILIMVFAQVFTTVYDYIPIVGPFFRDKFWLVFLVPSLGSILPALLPSARHDDEKVFSPSVRRDWMFTVMTMSVIALVGLSVLTAHPEVTAGEEPDTLRVFTYNIQQGYDDSGERNVDDQIALIRSKAPDIVGLQECDTARIAGGNVDGVAYFADRLNMYSYYGPSPVTGTFGIALLSRYPIDNPKTHFLFSEGEQVAVIEADITVGGQTYKIYITHLGNRGPIFQIRQMLDLMRGQDNVIAMGDFNFRHYEEQYTLATAEYDDAYLLAGTQRHPAGLDIEDRIDHVFVTRGMPISYAEYLPKGESDHPALFVEVKR